MLFEHWGARPEEIAGAVVGDDLVPDASLLATRSISLDAPPDQVYRWLAQMGFGKAGWYSYDWLDNVGRRSATEIRPGWQVDEGEAVPAGPIGFVAAIARPAEAFVLAIDRPRLAFSLAYDLRPEGTGTRLVTRLRARIRYPGGRLIERCILGPGDGVMVRRQLLGLRTRTRRSSEIGAVRRWTPMRFLTFPAFLLALALAVGACSGGSDDEPASASSDDDTSEPDAVERDVTEDEDDGPTATTTETAPDEPIVAARPIIDATVDGSDIELSWSDATGLRWEVLRDGSELDTTGQAAFTDGDLADGAYHYQVVAIGTEGDRIGSEVLIVEVGEPDVLAPPAPSDVTVDATDEQVTITWDAPGDLDDVRGYLVHRDRVFIAYVDDGTEYVDTDIDAGRAYNYRIRTQDDAGNVSEPEAARVPGESDTTAPTAPVAPTIVYEGNDLVITWGDSSDDEGIWGYLVHRDNEFVLWTGLDLEFREPAPTDGSQPVYLIRAQDFTGNVSVPSRAFEADASLRRGGTDQPLS